MGAVSVQLDHPGFEALPREQQMRIACNEFIGAVMFGEMLREARNSSLNSGLFSSPAQRAFQTQLDDVLLQQATGGPDSRGVFGELGDAMYRSLSGRSPLSATTPRVDVRG